MAGTRGTHEHWDSACCSGHDFGEDPLLPQKALPLPDDADVSAALPSDPADVVAAATSAMAACDGLPDGAAETLMQPLAEAYLLAVRREAQLLPKVVSALPARTRLKERPISGPSASSDAFCISKEAVACESETKAPAGKESSSWTACKGQMASEEPSTFSLTQIAGACPAAKTCRHARESSEEKAARNSSEVFPAGEAGQKASSFTCSSESSSDADSSDNEVQNPSQSEGPLAEFLNEFRSVERARNDNEARTRLAGISEEGGSCAAEFAVGSAEQRCELRNRCVHDDWSAPESIASHGGYAPQTAPAETVLGRTPERLSHAAEESVVVITPSQDGSAAGDSCCDAFRVRAGGGARHCGTVGEETAVSTGVPATVGRSNTNYSCAKRPTTETGKPSKDVRQKSAAYLDRLVLLDKQREAASASASAPATAWRATALQKFKGLRSYVSSSEFFLEEHQQPGVAADYLSWSEQEWQLYCRCYPPSLGVLGRCDTVTLCRLLLLLVEDVKQQQRGLSKRERKHSNSTGLSRCGDPVGWPQKCRDDASAKAENERSNSAPRMHAIRQSRTGEPEQVEECASYLQERGAEGDQDTGRNPLPKKEQHESTAVNCLQGFAKPDSAYSAYAKDDTERVNPVKEHTLQDTKESNSCAHEGKPESADEVATEAEVTCPGGCRCCRDRDCCITLQQACWLFGVFVFLDELQAMDADVASCIQQLRRLCESARDRATGYCSAVRQQLSTAYSAGEPTRDAPEGKGEGMVPLAPAKRTAAWVPTDLVAALNVLIVVINDFFNQR